MSEHICPDCGVSITTGGARPGALTAVEAHRGDRMCLMAQERTRDLTEWVPAGNFRRTLAEAGVEFKLSPYFFDASHVPAFCVYKVFAPRWAVWLAGLTSCPKERRVLALQHCVQHAAAREAASATAKLSVLTAPSKHAAKKKIMRRPGAQTSVPKADVVESFVTGLMLTVDPPAPDPTTLVAILGQFVDASCAFAGDLMDEIATKIEKP